MFLIAQEMAKSKIFTVSVIFLTCWYDVYYTRFFLLSLFVPGPAQNSSVIPFMVRDVVEARYGPRLAEPPLLDRSQL